MNQRVISLYCFKSSLLVFWCWQEVIHDGVNDGVKKMSPEPFSDRITLFHQVHVVETIIEPTQESSEFQWSSPDAYHSPWPGAVCEASSRQSRNKIDQADVARARRTHHACRWSSDSRTKTNG